MANDPHNTCYYVALIHLPTLSFEQIVDENAPPSYLSMPLALLYLSSTLKMKAQATNPILVDYAVAARELRNDAAEGRCRLSVYRDDPARFINETALKASAGQTPRLIALSLMFSPSRTFAIQVIEHLSRLWPEAVIVIGGNHATNDVTSLLDHPDVDYVCRGEADWAFPEFTNQLISGQIPQVPGFHSKQDKEAGKDLTALCAHPENLDLVPFPDWDLLDLSAYWSPTATRKRGFFSDHDASYVSMMTSRGCPFRCTFCASHTVHGRNLRLRSVENILEEMRLAYERYGVTAFIPEDDLFTGNKKHTLALLRGIRDLAIPNLQMEFPSALSVNTLDEEVIDALQEAGMQIFSLAIESGSRHTQNNLIKKRVNLDRGRRLVKYANDKGLYTRVNYILGFPDENMEHIQETIDYAKTLGADWSAIMVATPLLGSEMFDQFQQMGVLDQKGRNWERDYWSREFDTQEFKASDIKEIAYRANIEINFLHNRQIKLGNWELALTVFSNLVALHPHHVIAHYQIMYCLEQLGRQNEADEVLQRICHLLQNSNVAAEMMNKYSDLFPRMVDKVNDQITRKSEG